MAEKVLTRLKALRPLAGRCLPLPTVHELHPVHEEEEALVAEIDIKSANKVVKLLDSTFSRDPSLSLTHLRRFAKPEHLPDHLKKEDQQDGCSEPGSKQPPRTIHVLISPPLPDRSELEALLRPFAPLKQVTSDILETSSSSEVLIQSTRIHLQPPVSLEQAREWSRTHWPTTFNPAAQPSTNAPPLATLARTQASIETHAGLYLSLARELAREAEHAPQRGRPIGAVVVDPTILESNPDEPLAAVVAVAGDARYRDPDHDSEHDDENQEEEESEAEREDGQFVISTKQQPYNPDNEGQPSDHALMRVISIVSQKRLATSTSSSTANQSSSEKEKEEEKEKGKEEEEAEGEEETHQITTTIPPPPLSISLSPLETHFFNQTNLSSASAGGYLCTSLDIYITHEPCLCCAMGMLLSRFRAIVVGKRVKGSAMASLDAEQGYGLHWRKELNWRAMGFEFIQDERENDDDEREEDLGKESFGFHV